MKRETTNVIRAFLEDWIPPALKDSRLFLWVARFAYGRHIDQLSEFRASAWSASEEKYAELYAHHPRIHAETDNSEACVQAICNLTGHCSSILDVGCGSGYLLSRIAEKNALARLSGVDITLKNLSQQISTNINFQQGLVDDLPYEANAFDAVVCTHVLEHVLDLEKALKELRRVSARMLVIVVPKERESLYTFNPHLRFFPYEHSLLQAIKPPAAKSFSVRLLGRDFCYVEVDN